jgi:hypothetical protein
MKHTTSEIINAMQILKDTCSERDNCTCCPLCNSESKCELRSTEPKHWWITSKCVGR